MIKDKILKSVFIVLQTMIITGFTICSIANVSCRISAEGIKLLEGDYESPVLEKFVVEDSQTLDLLFSKKVGLTSCSVSLVDEAVENKSENSENELNYSIEECKAENGVMLKVKFKSKMILGKDYIFYGIVTDENGNSLTLEVPFKGYNSRVPFIVMTEIQSASVGSQTKSEKEAGIYRNEYVEFLCLDKGNLSGLELISGYDGESKKYVFPSVEVNVGEVFVVHLRNRGNGCINETGSNLNQAYASYSKPGIRDLWSSEEDTVLGNKTDVIVLRNQADGSIIDAVFYRDSSVENWSRDMEKYAKMAAEYGIYESYEPDFACITDGLTDTKTIYRKDAAQYKISYGLKRITIKEMNNSENWGVATPTPGEL